MVPEPYSGPTYGSGGGPGGRTAPPPSRDPAAANALATIETESRGFGTEQHVVSGPGGASGAFPSGVRDPLIVDSSWWGRLNDLQDLTPEATRILEPLFREAFGYDISRVSVRFGYTPRSVSAYTIGDRVTVNENYWKHATYKERLKTLAHEITHSVQYDRLDRIPILTRNWSRFEFLTRYFYEYATTPNEVNYSVPFGLEHAKIQDVDPLDPRYNYDQIADRTGQEIDRLVP
jgi:hypothetical protein